MNYNKGTNSFMVDTCCIGRIKEYLKTGNNTLLNKFNFYYSTPQSDEILHMANNTKKLELENILSNLNQTTVIAVFNQTKWGSSYFGSEKSLKCFKTIKEEELKTYKNSNKSIENMTKDAIIAASCIDKGLKLLTDDKNLIQFIKQKYPQLTVLTWNEFVKDYLKE